MQRRAFSSLGLQLSVMCFGTMRFSSERLSVRDAQELLDLLLQSGVNTIHTSSEYDTHPFFIDMLQRYQAEHRVEHLHHVMKLGEPHFDATRFDPVRFRRLVEAQLRDLGTERIDIVQWLLRHTPNEDAPRLEVWNRDRDRIESTIRTLQQEGKIGVMCGHPYSVTFAEAIQPMATRSGWVDYLNLAEVESTSLLDGPAPDTIAIRPFAGGSLLSDDHDVWDRTGHHPFCRERSRIEACLQYPLMHPRVASVMVSATTLGHARTALAALDASKVDRRGFTTLTELARA